MAPELIDTIGALRVRLRNRAGARLGFVPTMGALHAGHASLMDRARRECDVVAVSVFVNPIQFDRPEDLARYPRTLERDVELCGVHGVDVVFAPSVAEMYPSRVLCSVDVGTLADHLCGKYRPGHFRGVATVVLKLLQIVGPDVAYFGEKDAQQLAVVRRMVTDFNVPVQIAGVPTVREADGLAVSSRNVRLNAEERSQATALYRALRRAEEEIRSGATDAAAIVGAASAVIPAAPALSLEYLEAVDPDTFQPVARIQGPVIVAGALWVGATRLIDNLWAEPKEHA